MEAVPAQAFAFKNITKRFGNVVANRNVSFSVLQNSIHGVVGENGAGKSTIMKVLYGMFAPEEGSIEVRGKEVCLSNPQKAISLGIGMVHQHFMLVPTLSVWENIILGKEPTLGRIHKAVILRKLDELQKDFGFSLNLEAIVKNLSVGLQQQVEILKILYREAEILILDEPTAVLTPQEVDTLFERLRVLQKRNKTIIIITHKLREILEFTQFVTIMRQGSVVETVATSTLNEGLLAEKIIGHRRDPLPSSPSLNTQEFSLQVKNLSLTRKGVSLLSQINFNVQAGEIVGIAGIEGNGQHALVEVLAHVERDYEGEVLFKNHSLKEECAYGVKQAGLSIIPSDRQQEGLILSFSVEENSLLGHHKEKDFRRGVFLSPARSRKHAEHLTQEFDIRPRDTSLPIRNLSGGNQQKVIVARETSRSTSVLVAAHPTRGVDIGAIDFIHHHFLKLKREGTAILLISSELDEILSLSDRILVIYQGRIIGETLRKNASERELGLWMTKGSS